MDKNAHESILQISQRTKEGEKTCLDDSDDSKGGFDDGRGPEPTGAVDEVAKT